MRPVLILENQAPERRAYLGTWLTEHGIAYQAVNADEQDFPDSIEPYSALAVMGGAMSANDPLLNNRRAEILILQAMRLNLPVIGHCLGGQLMARALGARVRRADKPEIGWQPIEYAQNSAVQEWFGSEPSPVVIQWHYDTFDIPQGAMLLASSDACANQAFVYGNCLAMQFHIEIDATKTHLWVADEDPQWQAAQQQYSSVQTRQAILAGIETNLQTHQRMARAVYHRWLQPTEWAKYS